MHRRARSLRRLLLTAGLATFAAGGCAEYKPFDSAGYLKGQMAQRLGPEVAGVEVPFQLDPEIDSLLDTKLRPVLEEEQRVADVLDFIFGKLELKYSLVPTRDAVGTFRAHQGNCLSFVNLFVGIARHNRLNPFYVEVTDFQRWNERDGMVVSQGHIVAGMYVKGELKTYDFLPYRPKSYKQFKPIDDLTAAAHFYNNLGAEALMRGDVETAERLLDVATSIVPTFEKGLNNLGVVYARTARLDAAEKIYRKGLETEPDNLAILTNLARVYQQEGRVDEALALLSKIDVSNNTNPFFFVYQGDLALSKGDTSKALEYMVEALRRDNDVPEVHVGLVKVYLALGDLKRARYHLERALKLDATNQEALKYAAMLEKHG